MREFEALKELRLNWDYQLFGKSSKKPRLHSVGLPPELELLEFFNELGKDEEVTDLLLAMLQNKSVVARNLKRMVVVEGNDKVLREVKATCREQGLQFDIIGELDEDESDEDIDGVTDGEEEEEEEEDESD
jgi:Ran GTPase-activating protein (RanGAP) involved in mRNA processing and transport